MPNTGKPSQDCHLCRKRRVKCDLTRPSCNRCIKYGVECPGYRNQQELIFRSANPLDGKKRKKRLNSSEYDSASTSGSSTDGASPTSSAISSTCDSDGPTLAAAQNNSALAPTTTTTTTTKTSNYVVPLPWANESFNSADAPLGRSLSEHWTTHSVPILLNVYSALDFLYNTCRRTTNGPLLWAAHLFSRTYVTNLRYSTAIQNESLDETQREMGMYMGKALSAVSLALQTPSGALRDDVLATVWILTNYEVLVGSLDRLHSQSPWHLHTRGLYSILKARGVEHFRTPTGRMAFWPTFNLVQLQNLMTNTATPPETDEWLAMIRDNMFEGEALTLNISVYISRVSRLLTRIVDVLQAYDFRATAEIHHDIWTQLTHADDGMTTWMFAQPDGNVSDPYMRNMQSSAVVKAFHMMQLMINFLTHDADCPIPMDELLAQRRYCIRRVRAAADEILRSIPRALGPLAGGTDTSPRVLFDALKLVWPLSAVYMVGTTSNEQKAGARATLEYIGREIGVRQALKAHSTLFFLPSESKTPAVMEEDQDGPDVFVGGSYGVVQARQSMQMPSGTVG